MGSSRHSRPSSLHQRDRIHSEGSNWIRSQDLGRVSFERGKESGGHMRIKWLGHACFLLTSDSGLRVITDPYAVGGGINYSPIRETADVVLVSHDHGDHNNVSAVQGKPEVVRGSGTRTVKGVQFKGIATSHDASQGTERGTNT